MTEKDTELALKCIAVWTGNYPAEKQYAATIILKMLFKNRYNKLLAEMREATGFKVNNRLDSKVSVWAKKVKKAGKCAICGSKERLEAHHIIPWECSITGRTDINNGMCLCHKCHHMMHDDDEWLEYMMNR